jgi:hypothetical protein
MAQSAHLNIYRENTFRITGLSVDSSEREIKKHAEKLKLLAGLGQGRTANKAAFALSPPPSVEQIRTAMQRLKEPELRLIDEFFWFWPNEFGKSTNDPAIQAILAGDAATAYDIWTRMETDPNRDFIAWHNIAVFFHLKALDCSPLQVSTEIDEEEEEVKHYWKEALSRWKKASADDRLWDTIKARICAIDDPRLHTGFGKKIRETLPNALNKINAEAALKFAENGKMEWAKFHLAFVRDADCENTGKVSELVLTPARKRVLQYIDSAKSEYEKTQKDGAAAIEHLLGQSKPMQSLFALFHGKNSFHTSELFDDVALTAHSRVRRYYAKTLDFSKTILLLCKTLVFATEKSVLEKIQRDITELSPDLSLKIQNNIESSSELCAKKPESGINVAVSFLEQWRPFCVYFDAIYKTNSVKRLSLLDEIALHIVSCVEQYSKKTKDVGGGVLYFREALKFAGTAEVRVQIQNKISIARVERATLEISQPLSRAGVTKLIAKFQALDDQATCSELHEVCSELIAILNDNANAATQLVRMKIIVLPLLKDIPSAGRQNLRVAQLLSASCADVLWEISYRAQQEKNEPIEYKALEVAVTLARDDECKRKIKDRMRQLPKYTTPDTSQKETYSRPPAPPRAAPVKNEQKRSETIIDISDVRENKLNAFGKKMKPMMNWISSSLKKLTTPTIQTSKHRNGEKW